MDDDNLASLADGPDPGGAVVPLSHGLNAVVDLPLQNKPQLGAALSILLERKAFAESEQFVDLMDTEIHADTLKDRLMWVALSLEPGGLVGSVRRYAFPVIAPSRRAL